MYASLMSIPGFDAAQARYDSMLPADPVHWTCPISGESTEDCDQDDHDECPEPEDDRDCEPPDFDEWRHGMGRYAEDSHLDDW